MARASVQEEHLGGLDCRSERVKHLKVNFSTVKNEDLDAGMEYLNSINEMDDHPDSIKRKITERHKLRRISQGNREARGNVG